MQISSLDEVAKNKLAEIVVKARGERSQADFAKLLGVSQSTVQSWENKKNTPTLENIEKIAEVTGHLPEELIAYLYGRDAGGPFSVETQIDNLSMTELSSLLEAVSKRLAQED